MSLNHTWEKLERSFKLEAYFIQDEEILKSRGKKSAVNLNTWLLS